ncbi:hypothetical protein D9M72_540890 [compost metagenome]
MYRQAQPAAGDVVGGELDRGLGVRIAADRSVHACMHLREISEFDADQRWCKVFLDHRLGDERGLAEVAAKFPAPVFQRWCLAPAYAAVTVDDTGQQVATNGFGQTGPFVFSARGKLDKQRFYRLDRRHRETPQISSSVLCSPSAKP